MQTVTYPGELSLCTFGPGNVVSGGEPASAIGAATHKMSINGTLFTDGFIADNTRVFTLSNCAYRADITLGSNITAVDCVTASAEELAQFKADFKYYVNLFKFAEVQEGGDFGELLQ